jgi:hypothetical protein
MTDLLKTDIQMIGSFRTQYNICHESHIYDCFGTEIFPGNVLLIADSHFHANLVLGIDSKFIYTTHRHDDLINPTYLNIIPNQQAIRYLSDEKGCCVHYYVLNNPLFYIENKSISILLEIADSLKENEFFPKDYKLGDSLLL